MREREHTSPMFPPGVQAPRIAIRKRAPASPPITAQPKPPLPFRLRVHMMAHVGWRMLAHGRSKTVGIVFGIVFSLVLTNQSAGMFQFLLSRNISYIDHAGADVWVVPSGTRRLQSGAQIPIGALMEARVTPGVDWAEPIIWGHAAVKLPKGGSEAVTLIGARYPRFRGGPYNMVAGGSDALLKPDAVVVEDSWREKLGGLNLDDTPEMNGRRVRVTGFTWGLIPFGPPLAFAEYDLAREMLDVAPDRVHYVLVGLQPGADLARVKADLRQRIPEAQVMTSDELRASTKNFVLVDEGVGGMIMSGMIIALIVGFAIVSLTMFSAVIENLREFATMKAMGATNTDLGFLLLAQSLICSVIGSVVGTALTCLIWTGARSPALNIIIDPAVACALAIITTVVSAAGSMIALNRVRRVDPAAVFR